MTPLPADIEDGIWEYVQACIADLHHGDGMAKKWRVESHAKLTALLSGYIEKADYWDDHESARGSCNRGFEDFK